MPKTPTTPSTLMLLFLAAGIFACTGVGTENEGSTTVSKKQGGQSCLSDDECAPLGLLCDVALGECRQCLDDSHCPGDGACEDGQCPSTAMGNDTTGSGDVRAFEFLDSSGGNDPDAGALKPVPGSDILQAPDSSLSDPSSVEDGTGKDTKTPGDNQSTAFDDDGAAIPPKVVDASTSASDEGSQNLEDCAPCKDLCSEQGKSCINDCAETCVTDSDEAYEACQLACGGDLDCLSDCSTVHKDSVSACGDPSSECALQCANDEEECAGMCPCN